MRIVDSLRLLKKKNKAAQIQKHYWNTASIEPSWILKNVMTNEQFEHIKPAFLGKYFWLVIHCQIDLHQYCISNDIT